MSVFRPKSLPCACRRASCKAVAAKFLGNKRKGGASRAAAGKHLNSGPLRPFKQDAGDKGYGRAQKPLQPPHLHCLPVQDRADGVKESEEHSGKDACQASGKGHEGHRAQTSALLYPIQEVGKRPQISPYAPRSASQGPAGFAAYVAKAGANHELVATAVADLHHAPRGFLGLRLRHGGLPEFLPCTMDDS